MSALVNWFTKPTVLCQPLVFLAGAMPVEASFDNCLHKGATDTKSPGGGGVSGLAGRSNGSLGMRLLRQCAAAVSVLPGGAPGAEHERRAIAPRRLRGAYCLIASIWISSLMSSGMTGRP